MEQDLRAEALDLFWKNEDRQKLVRDAVRLVRTELKISPETLARGIKIESKGKVTILGKSIQRLAERERNELTPAGKPKGSAALRPCAHMSNLLKELLHQLTGCDQAWASELSKRLLLLQNEETKVVERFAREADPSEPRPEPQQTDIDTIASGMLAWIMTLLRSDLAAAKEAYGLFGDSSTGAQSQETHFDCYRYHSTPNKVIKAFLAIQGPSATFPGCRFVHIFGDAEGSYLRKARGVVIPTQSVIYLLGYMEGEQGLKLIALDRPPGRRNSFTGLIISFDEGGELIAARILLKRSSATKHEDAGIGAFSAEELRKDLSDEDLNKIRNRVTFKLEPKTVYLGGQEITNEDMLEEISKRLQDANGRSIFQTADGRQFRPTYPRSYPYNSALKLWSSNED